MDQRLKTALEHANYVTTFKNQKRVLLEKFSKECTVYFAGGQFTTSRDMLRSLMTCETDIFVDNNNTPIEILEKGKFYNRLEEAIIKASDNYYSEYQKIVKSERTVQGIVDV